MAGPLELIAAARLRHPEPALLVVAGGEAFPPDGRPLPPLVAAVLDAERARAAGDVAGALALFADDVVWFGHGSGALVGPWHGPEGVVRFFTEWYSVFESHDGRLELVIDHGDRVVVLWRQRGRSRAAGVEVEMVNYGVYWFRDGRAVRVEFFDSLESALSA